MERFFEKEINLILFIVIVIFASALFQRIETPVASARNRPWPAWTDRSRLDLARCVRAESDYFKRDWPLLAWCLVKQWRSQPYGRTIGGQIRAHCAVFDRGNRRYYERRQKQIRASTWENPLHGTREQWRELEVFVDSFTAGAIPDDCPKCRWWAGHVDHVAENWICPIGPVAGRGNRFCYVLK